MISCLLKGGLGNVLFQVAATHALAREHGDVAVFDLKNHWANQGRRPTRYRETLLRQVLDQRSPKTTAKYLEPHFHYAPIPYQPGLLLDGYFQSPRYFDRDSQTTRELFAPPDDVLQQLRKKYGALLEAGAVSLHVRRGDYLKLAQNHPVCSLEYYRRAEAALGGVERYLVFSDDLQWCQQNFVGSSYHFVREDREDFELILMSLCRHHIIANSSFSWWGAWLNPRPDRKVVAPRTWFGPSMRQHDARDLLPGDWVAIDSD